MRLQNKRISLFADYHQFYLWDPQTEPKAPEDYTPEDIIRRIKVGPHVVVIQPERNMEVPVEIEIHDSEPTYDPDEWDHIAEASLHLPSGNLQVHQCTSGPVADFSVDAAWYRVRSFHGNLHSISYDGVDGDDFYRIVLWPAPPAEVDVIYQFGSTATVDYVDDFPVGELRGLKWDETAELSVVSNWDGTYANGGRHFGTRLLWSENYFYVRFDAIQRDPLVVTEKPIIDQKTIGLWERDVCEIFIAPDRAEPRKYFEFEIAPTGEWIDLAIDLTSGERVTDTNYRSGMETAASIEERRVVMAMKVPWAAFGTVPKRGDVWLGNIFRCVGRDPHRGYLAWQPTFTETPNFHVPNAFGEFHFVS